MKKKIIGVSVVVALLAVLCAQSAAAQATVEVYAWTDKPQYKPGETGTLYITIVNGLQQAVTIDNIKIQFPWHSFEKDEWVGNETIEITPSALSGGESRETEVQFEVPTDGRLLWDDEVTVEVWTVEFPNPFEPGETVEIIVASISVPMEVLDLDLWMTSLIVAVVICTIILAIAAFLSTRRPTAPRVLPPPPPPKPKAKAE